MEDVRAFYTSLEASGIPKRYTHNMADYQVNSVSLVAYVVILNPHDLTRYSFLIVGGEHWPWNNCQVKSGFRFMSL